MQGKLRILVLALLSVVAVAGAQTVPAIEAPKHVGEQATVCGRISGEHYAAQSAGSPTFINFERPYPNAPFTAVVWGRDRGVVGVLPSDGRLCVKGQIEVYKGVPQIVLHNAASWFVPKSTADSPTLSNDNHYTNSDGQRVHSPAKSSGGVPPGATALCRDGTYSFSQHRSGTCSHHGGVSKWL